MSLSLSSSSDRLNFMNWEQSTEVQQPCVEQKPNVLNHHMHGPELGRPATAENSSNNFNWKLTFGNYMEYNQRKNSLPGSMPKGVSYCPCRKQHWRAAEGVVIFYRNKVLLLFLPLSGAEAHVEICVGPQMAGWILSSMTTDIAKERCDVPKAVAQNNLGMQGRF